jgi:hypothetical protein
VVLPGAIFVRNLRERSLRRREDGKLFQNLSSSSLKVVQAKLRALAVK